MAKGEEVVVGSVVAKLQATTNGTTVQVELLHAQIRSATRA